MAFSALIITCICVAQSPAQDSDSRNRRAHAEKARAAGLSHVDLGSAIAPSLDALPPSAIPRNLSSAPNEILLWHNGGTIAIDGITFTKKVADFPPLSISKQYLCLLAISADGKVAIAPLAGAGVVEITARDALQPLRLRAHPLIEDLSRSYSNSLTQLSFHVRQRARNEQ